MPQFSERSIKNLETCDGRIKVVMHHVIKYMDISITEGYRKAEEQMEAYEKGLSQLIYPKSKHNKKPSKAVHAIPYPFHGWDKPMHFIYMAGFIVGISYELGYPLRWGGDWDQDFEVITDQKLDDLAHFELVD